MLGSLGFCVVGMLRLGGCGLACFVVFIGLLGLGGCGLACFVVFIGLLGLGCRECCFGFL